MWSPTHIEVTVQRARGLLTKGKNGTNNCFVTISLGKEKYQTSVKEKAESNINWNEECELKIPDQGNRAELMLTCLHRNNLGIDEFLGQVTLPLNEMDVYERPRSKWYSLESKPGKEKKNKERGELEVRLSFVVRSGSLTDLNKKDKHKSSIGQLASSVGGSLLSIGTIEKRKGIKKFAKSLGSKMHLHGKRKSKDGDDVSYGSGSFASIGTPTSSNGGSRRYGQRAGEADPGVISEDEDEFVFDNLSHKSSGSSLNLRSNVAGSAGTGGGGIGSGGGGGSGGGIGVGHTNLQTPTGPGPLPMSMPTTMPLMPSQPSPNVVPSNPSPLMAGGNVKTGGKQSPPREQRQGSVLGANDSEFTALRGRPLPPPSKPPRTQQAAVMPTSTSTSTTTSTSTATTTTTVTPTLDEWEAKLYGATETLKRRSWETTRVPLTTIKDDERHDDDEKPIENNVNDDNNNENEINDHHHHHNKDVNAIVNGMTERGSDGLLPTGEGGGSDKENAPHRWMAEGQEASPPSLGRKMPSTSVPTNDKNATTLHLLTPEIGSKDFHQFNASFAKFEQSNSAKIFLPDEEEEREKENEKEKEEKEKEEKEKEKEKAEKERKEIKVEAEEKQQQRETETLKPRMMKEERGNQIEMEKKQEDKSNTDKEAMKPQINSTKESHEVKESIIKKTTEKKDIVEEFLMNEVDIETRALTNGTARENVKSRGKMALEFMKRAIPQENLNRSKEKQQQPQQQQQQEYRVLVERPPLPDENITKAREGSQSKRESAAVAEEADRQRTPDLRGLQQQSSKIVEALKVVKGFGEPTSLRVKESPTLRVEELKTRLPRNEEVKKTTTTTTQHNHDDNDVDDDDDEVKLGKRRPQADDDDDDDEANRRREANVAGQQMERRHRAADLEAKRRDERRHEEDQRILNFAKRPLSVEESDEGGFTTPPLASSPKQASADKKQERRLNKFKYFSKRDKLPMENRGVSSSSPKCTERIIIGHEKASTHAERRPEVTAALNKKYEGKSREELMVIANGMENEALIQRQRVKELEDYLDNLLLRVMETHPKILQNPYSRTSSTKCFKTFIGINDFP